MSIINEYAVCHYLILKRLKIWFKSFLILNTLWYYKNYKEKIIVHNTIINQTKLAAVNVIE